jgi:ubiquinone/menaquinone biosynthesis C-methylase UbiE
MSLKQLNVECKKIVNKVSKINKTLFIFHFIVNEIILLELEIENILFQNKNKDPVIPALNLIKNLNKKIDKIISLQNHDGLVQIKKNSLVDMEKSHQILFQKLWTNYSLKQYKIDRIKRYEKRIKINKLEKFIKNKKVVDFGCGHGNFLIACNKFNPMSCLGIDYGKGSIKYAKSIVEKLNLSKDKFNFKVSSVYKTKIKSGTYDFAIQNGVFHHLKDEKKAYLEVHRVLKKGAYFWVYTDGGGGLRDIIYDMCQKIINKIDKNYIVNQIRSAGLNYGKTYHLSDNMNAIYRHTTYKKIKLFLEKLGFKNFRQLNGGFSTDIDKPFCNDKYFQKKFGSGDLRILCQKA